METRINECPNCRRDLSNLLWMMKLNYGDDQYYFPCAECGIKLCAELPPHPLEFTVTICEGDES